jgi:hypothetical protein
MCASTSCSAQPLKSHRNETGKGGPYEEIIATLSGVNYREVFRCKPA